MKFLIDECLSPCLANQARNAGFIESTHVNWRGFQGKKDWELKPVILEEDWTFVTHNSVDFRGPVSKPGSKGQYAGVELHAGLVCLNSKAGMSLKLQKLLFEYALGQFKTKGITDLINKCVEVDCDQSADTVQFQLYDLPSI
ncbi:DUF5615 family PIN-like protein [Thalassospira lucentensis]|uniref:DUF5615 family PIN-like protein n=1 Tax=Thalassospira lucentensis TaxID=168935 RepID=UPI002943EF55|nr:DUF5615 family PIN-like protein [Thalassospira lucentensis]WOI08985.1 DUF5615 family PIN-like protein [Thalassospira lucentensis]